MDIFENVPESNNRKTGRCHKRCTVISLKRLHSWWSRKVSFRVLFNVQHLYYLPQYLRCRTSFKREGASVQFVLQTEKGLDEIKQKC